MIDLKVMKGLDSNLQVLAKEYCVKRNFLVRGSSRALYRISDSYVLKIAKRKKGFIQSKTECNLYNILDSKEMLCSIHAYDENFSVMLMDYVEPVVEDPTDVVLIEIFYEDREKPSNYYEALELIDFLVENYGLEKFDLRRIANWGIKDNKLILLDYGLTEDCFNNYYKA